MLTLALTALGSGCAERAQQEWSSPQSVAGALADTDPVRPPAVRPLTRALDGTSRVTLTVPAVYRVEFAGEVSGDGAASPFAVGGWLLLVEPHDTEGASGNDVNIVDLGLRTDTSPLDGTSGALWFGSHTSVMGSMDLGGMTPNAGPVDLVTQTAETDTLLVEVVPQLAPVNTLNLFHSGAGPDTDPGPHAVLAGTVQLRFSPDAASVTGRLDLTDTTSGAAYTADLTGQRTSR